MHRHIFSICDKLGYEYCTECGTYHSYMQANPKDIYENNYWSYEHNRSKPEEQVLNLQCTDDCGISKVDKVLEFVPKINGGAALEIGAFPGVLLRKLVEIGYGTVGIEPDGKNMDFIINQSPYSAILHGYFPEVTKGLNIKFDCIISLDVVEHIQFYEPFIEEVYRLLDDGGVFVMMSPIIKDGKFRQRDFDHFHEHAWLWSYDFFNEYLQTVFKKVEFGTWILGHEIFCCTK